MMIQQERGAAVVIALSVVVMLVVFGSTLLTRSLHESSLMDRARFQHAAFHNAEAALDHALEQIAGGVFGDVGTHLLSGGSYWAEVWDVTEDVTLDADQYRIFGHGLFQLEQRDLEVVAEAESESVFQFALFGSSAVEVSGTAITDSFDSSVAPYDSDTAGDSGDVGTNAIAEGGIVISGSIAINGQVAVGEGGDPETVVTVDGGSALITGEPPFLAQSNNLDMPAVSTPPGLSCTIPFSIAGGHTMILPDDAPAGACNGNGECCFSDLSAAGGATLTTSVPISVYVTGSFSATGNTTIGVPTDPTQFLLILASPEQATISGDWAGNTEFYGGVYAPTGDIEIKGNAEIFGSVIGEHVIITGDAQIHYDEALIDIGPTGSYELEVVLWRDL